MTRLALAFAALVVAVAVAYFAAAGLIVGAIRYPGIPLLATLAYVVARQSIHPHPYVTRLRSLA